MPSIVLDIAPLTKEQKAQIVKEFTESASRITGIDSKAFYVFVNEYPRDCIGVGGALLSDRRSHAGA
ncbi:MAG: tautomerase family protein [Candidatus Methanomethylophilaceae archaeon]|nr:tautomerase family protein [Candidatus Methanomethylophilaceae archaeon]